ncbi:MAG: crotonase/enoyl-CoA hydratase family protein [Syntrophomonadaceae bacterium]|jgi:enoyl-CoA hydratase/carnithine racemase|nr:crotonase/enoyl-CoA hydratase family protein [Syntrophomonadaceae bacterium]
MDFEQIKYETADRILTITLNRPDNMNAFTRQMVNEIIAALDQAEKDPDIRAIVVTGSPAGRAFSAGSDLSSKGGDTFNYSKTTIEEHRDGGGVLALRLLESKKPIIAAMNGSAVGIGLTITFPMDIRIIADNAKLGIVFVRRGIVIDACCSWLLPRLVGMGKALEWCLSGRIFTAQEALESGLANYVVPPDQVLPKAYELAREIAANTAPVSVAMVRQMLLRLNSADHPMEAHRIESKMFYWLGQQADVKEGIASFKEKRAPQYSMDPSRDIPPFYPWWKEPPFKE